MGHESVWLSSDLPRQPAPAPGYLRVPASDLPFQTLGVAYPLWTPRAATLLQERIEWCDVVNPHDCLYPGTLLALHYARRAGKPLILTQHAGPWPFYRSPILRAVQLAAYRTLGLAVHRRVAQAVFISRAVEAWFGARVRYLRPAFCQRDTALFTYGDAAVRGVRGAQRLAPHDDRRIAPTSAVFVSQSGLPARRGSAAIRNAVRADRRRTRSAPLESPQRRRSQPQEIRMASHYWAGDALIPPVTGEGSHGSAEAMVCGAGDRLCRDLRGVERRPRVLPRLRLDSRSDRRRLRLATAPARSRRPRTHQHLCALPLGLGPRRARLRRTDDGNALGQLAASAESP
jgi:hypothetical protein